MEPEIISHARRFMLSYMQRVKIARPTDFDRDILGLESRDGLLLTTSNGRLVWNETPFCVALGLMVDCGEIVAHEDDEGWRYEMPTEATS